MSLVRPNINLFGKKVLCVDDLISSGNPDTEGERPFLYNTQLAKEDVFFTNAYENALDIMEENPDISLAFVDIRIPKKSSDLEDFNPQDPTQGWGSTLLKELVKRYKNRKLEIIIITAYRIDDLSDPGIINLGRAFFEKPLDYAGIIKEINKVVDLHWKRKFDYESLDAKSSSFVKTRTVEIKKLVKRTIEDSIKIGNYLIEVKRELGHGKFSDWLSAEFSWTDRTAANLMNVAENFKIETVSNLNITLTALYTLASSSIPEEAREEVIKRAKEGEKITTGTAKKIKKKHIEEQKKNFLRDHSKSINKNPVINIELSENESEDRPILSTTRLLDNKTLTNRELTNTSLNTKSPQILSIQHNAFPNSFWQIGEKHQLFCGEPKNPQFIKVLPDRVNLFVGLPANQNFSLIPEVKSEYSFLFSSEYYDPEVELNTIENTIRETILNHTDARSKIVFAYIFDPQLLELADSLECNCYIAEPDLEKCDRIIKIWRNRGNVKRISK